MDKVLVYLEKAIKKISRFAVFYVISLCICILIPLSMDHKYLCAIIPLIPSIADLAIGFRHKDDLPQVPLAPLIPSLPLTGKVKVDDSLFRLQGQLNRLQTQITQIQKDILEIQGNIKDNVRYFEHGLKMDERIANIEDQVRDICKSLQESERETIIQSINTGQSVSNSRSLTMTAVDMLEGHNFEYFCAELLKKAGYQNVLVTKGSGDQGVDVLAEKDDIKYAIQCKCYSSELNNKSVQEVYAGKDLYNCQLAVVMTNNYFTPSAKTLAQATGVLLWDRDKVKELIEKTYDAETEKSDA